MKNTFKKGLILGGILALGAAVGFMTTKSGQEMSEELQKDLKALSKKLRKQLYTLEDVTKEHFDELVSVLVDEFAKDHALAVNAKNQLLAALDETWIEMEAAYQIEQENKA